ncbi:MAG: RsmG family class I SAM-dependent methyltransferase, partial [Ilumatobacteraceae bacterium]
MPDSGQERLLVDVLSRAQAEGALGQRPIADVIQHARSFVDALPSDVTTVMDIGSGAGVPGLIIALDRPTVQLTLVDRRAKRVDALRRAIAVLEWGDRVVAHEGDVNQLSR